MANSLPIARVRTIKLLEFKYDRAFKAAEGTPIQFNVQVKHRIPAMTTRLEVLVVITYTEEEPTRTEPLLLAECLTIYLLDNVITEIDEDSGKETISLPEELMSRLFAESIAHSRALLAAQTAGTTFGGTHVEIRSDFPTENKFEL
ncbi:MAG: hypothetical protein EOO61_18020 [Hymenobacter sp.]|nr:MAG: hypothetical protein EOO61_18020 [Hymenobacter sp.]